MFELSEILWAGVLIISHPTQCSCTSPASHLHQHGLFSLLYCVWKYPPYIPTSRSRLNPTCMATHSWAGSTSLNSPYQKGPVHFKTAGIQSIAGRRHHVQHPSRVWARQNRLRPCAAARFSRLCWATFVTATRAGLVKKLLFTGDSKGMPAFLIILQPGGVVSDHPSIVPERRCEVVFKCPRLIKEKPKSITRWKRLLTKVCTDALQ